MGNTLSPGLRAYEGRGEGRPALSGRSCVVANRLFFRAAIRCPFLSLSLSLASATEPAILVPTRGIYLCCVALAAGNVRKGLGRRELGSKPCLYASLFRASLFSLSWNDVRCFF